MSATATTFLEELIAQVGPDGGWGYTAGQPGQLEPTCLALLALNAERAKYRDQMQAGIACLKTHVLPDGSVRLNRGRAEAVWPTALALHAMATLGATEVQLAPLGSAVLGVAIKTIDQTPDDVNDINTTLAGWGWAEGNFSWVEPTAWACLALQRIGQDPQERVQDGLRVLLDRTLPEGGLNYGNRVVLGIALEPIPTPTALALLALQRLPREERIVKSVRYLSERALLGDDVEHLCWARLALDVYRDIPGVEGSIRSLGQRIEESVASRKETPYLKPSPGRVALTALALNLEQGNPFRLPAFEKRDLLPARPLIGDAPGFFERWRRTFRDIHVRAQAVVRSLEPKSVVHIAPVSGYSADLVDVLSRQYEGFRASVPLKGKRVVLKPNIVEYHRDKVINTHPSVIAAVIELCFREGAAEVIVGEGPGHWRNVEYLVRASGLGDVLKTYKVSFVDLNHDEPVQRPNKGRFTGLEHIYLAQTIANADVVISLPKLKTHHWAGATLSLKNLFGIVPGICYGWPKNELHWRGIHNSIVDIAATRMPDLAIVDGIVGMEGDGPLNGTPVEMGVLVMGTDLVAVDATCCRLMQLAPEFIDYLRQAAGRRLGWLPEGRIEQRGETIAARKKPFGVVKHFEGLKVV
jgi:uncharacterized protein (DUF362 family)